MGSDLSDPPAAAGPVADPDAVEDPGSAVRAPSASEEPPIEGKHDALRTHNASRALRVRSAALRRHRHKTEPNRVTDDAPERRDGHPRSGAEASS